MHKIIAFLFFCVLAPSHALDQPQGIPTLAFPETDPAIAQDLQKLSLKYAHCHISTVLLETQVSVNLMTSPHALTVIGGRRLENRSTKTIPLSKHGTFPIPSLTKIKNPCQAQILVVLSRPTWPLSAKAFSRGLYLEIELIEGAMMRFRLKEKHTVLLITRESFDGNKEVTFDPMTYYHAGGNILWILLYSNTSIGHLAVQSGHLTCYPCVTTELDLSCSGLENCFLTMEHAYRAITEGGRSVKWSFLPQREPHFTGTYEEWQEACLFNREGQSCSEVRPKNVVMSYMLRSLNQSVLGVPLGGPLAFRLAPVISWSEDNTRVEEAVQIRLLPIQTFPVYNPNRTKYSLKFITSDGIYQKVPSLYMYIQPLHRTIWLSAGITFVFALAVIVTVSKSAGVRSRMTALKWSMCWIYGAMLEQVDDPVLPTPPAETTAGKRKMDVKWVLISVLWLLCLLNNVYRAVLNVNYLTGSDLRTRWQRVEQLSTQNFRHIYIVLDEVAWLGKDKVFQGPDVTVIPYRRLSLTCDTDSRFYYIPPVSEAACFLQEEINMWQRTKGLDVWNCHQLQSRLEQNATQLGSYLKACKHKKTILFWRLNQKFRYFSEEELHAFIRSNLTRPKTAFLLTEKFMPHVWPEFETAMRENKSLRFSHNYFSPEDTAVEKQQARIIISSGMPYNYTKVVTDRAHQLLSAGIWKFLISLAYTPWTRGLPRLEPVTVPDFVPLSLRHDGVYLLFHITGSMFGICILTFLVRGGLHCLAHDVNVELSANLE